MSTPPRLAVYAGIVIASAGMSALCFHRFPAWRSWLFWEAGPVQILQVCVLLGAAAAGWRIWRRLPSGSEDRPVALALAGLLTVLFWREFEIDAILLNKHAFSWEYLFDRTPIWKKLLLGAPSVAFTVWVLRGVVPHARRSLELVWQRRRLVSPWLLVAGMSLLVASQLWDRSRSVQRRTGSGIFRSHYRDSPQEETLETCGELVLLFCALEFGREVRSRQGAKLARRTAAPAARPQLAAADISPVIPGGAA